MPTLYANDRSKASEHAIFIWRQLNLTPERIMRVLPDAGERLAGKLELVAPAPLGRSTTMPIELRLRPSHQGAEWWIELRISVDGERYPFFEGELRLHAPSHRRSEVLLLGRFTFPRELYAHVEESVMHNVAEDNLVRAFERLVLEIEAAAAAPADRPVGAPRQG